MEGSVTSPRRSRSRARVWLRRLVQRLRWRGRPAEPLSWGQPPHERERASSGDDRSAWWLRLTGREPSEVLLLLELAESLPIDGTSTLVGIGYAAPSQEKEWRPLLLLDARRLGMRPLHAPIMAELLDLPWPPFIYDLRGALVLPVLRPEPLGGVQLGESVRSRASRATVTVGTRAVRPLGGELWQRGFLTAGHGFPSGPGTRVYSVPKSRVGRYLAATFGGGKRLGKVAFHESPFPPDGEPRYDFAFVDLEYEESGEWDAEGFLPDFPNAPDFSRPRDVVFQGGASRRMVRGTLMGALMGMECWRDCWMFGPTCAAKKGDSGSAVALEPGNENLGVLVGRSAVGEQEHHVYVQSLQCLVRERLRAEGVLIEQFMNGGNKWPQE